MEQSFSDVTMPPPDARFGLRRGPMLRAWPGRTS